MSNLEELDKSGIYELESPRLDEKNEIGSYPDAKAHQEASGWTPPEEWLERLKEEYSGRGEYESLPPGGDLDRFALAIFTMGVEHSVDCLHGILNNLQNDYTFDQVQAARMRVLVQGHEVSGLDYDEWAYQVCKMAGIYHNWSAYLEVRSCTLPYDDVDEPCETFRAYLVGFFWVIVMTGVNTCQWRTVPHPPERKLTSLSLRPSSARYLHPQPSLPAALRSLRSRSGLHLAQVEHPHVRPHLQSEPLDAMERQGAAVHHHPLLRRLVHR